MKDIFVLCVCVLMICFTFATAVGVVCATIDIILSKKRYSVEASADVVPEDYLEDEPVQADVSVENKKVIS